MEPRRARNRGGLCALATAALALALTGTASANTITVANHHNAGQGSLRHAVNAANPGDTVIVPTGTYKLTTGEIQIDKQLVIRGHDARHTIVSGTHTSRIFSTNAGPLRLVGLTIANGVVPGGGDSSGGGISIAGGAAVTIVRSTIRDNRSGPTPGFSSYGGGISSNGPLTIRNSTLSGNHNDNTGTDNAFGGAIESGTGGALTIVNSTIANNTATGEGAYAGLGAGVYFEQNATIRNSTIAGNVSDDIGTGIYNNGGTGQVGNTILANGADNCQGTLSSLGFNLQSGNDCGFSGSGDQKNKSPKLTPLQNNGGHTNTKAPRPGSPAIDKGGNCPPPSTDQRGVHRPQGPRCDIGAVEIKP
jgi:hypothetical protein